MGSHNFQTEQTILGPLLLDFHAIVTVAPLLNAIDFYDPTHKTIFSAMLHLMEEGSPTQDWLIAGSYPPLASGNRTSAIG